MSVFVLHQSVVSIYQIMTHFRGGMGREGFRFYPILQPLVNINMFPMSHSNLVVLVFFLWFPFV